MKIELNKQEILTIIETLPRDTELRTKLAKLLKLINILPEEHLQLIVDYYEAESKDEKIRLGQVLGKLQYKPNLVDKIYSSYKLI